MGVIFFLGFVLTIVAIGAATAFVGILILAIRSVRKRKTGKKHRVSKILGTICIVAGGLTAIIPLALVALIVGGGAVMSIFDAREEAYFSKYVKTDTVVEASEDSDCFECKGEKYVPVNCFYVTYRDKNRKEAVANLKQEEGTVFRYQHPSGCRLLCIYDSIYCWEDDMEKLKEYYCNGQFNYVCEYYDGEDGDEEPHEMKVAFSDDLFWELCEKKTEKLKLVSKDRSNYDLEILYQFDIEQNRTEENMSRYLFVTVSTDGGVYIDQAEPLVGDEKNTDYLYLVTDKAAAEKFLQIGKKTQGSAGD